MPLSKEELISNEFVKLMFEYAKNGDKNIYTILNELTQQKQIVVLNEKDEYGWSLIHWAIYMPNDNSEKLIETCLLPNINIGLEQRTGYGFWHGYETPLHIAIRYSKKPGNIALGLYLLGKGASPADKDQNGWTALHWACSENCEHIAETIIYSWAELLTTKDKNGNTPLHLAAEKNHHAIAKLLLGHDFSLLKIKNAKNQTPMELAKVKGYDFEDSVIKPLMSIKLDQTVYNMIAEECKTGSNDNPYQSFLKNLRSVSGSNFFNKIPDSTNQPASAGQKRSLEHNAGSSPPGQKARLNKTSHR